MEMNVEKSKVMRISREQPPLQIMVDQNELDVVEYSNYVRGIITNDVSCTREINQEVPWQKQSSKRGRLH
jgi:hypothetical protein